MTLLLSLVLAAAAAPQDEESRPPEAKEIEELMGEIGILTQFQKAGVTRSQAKKLLEAIEVTQSRLKEIVEENEAFVEEAIDLLKEARDILARGEALDGDLQQRMAELGARGAAVKQESDEVRNGVAEKARGILTAKQISRMGGNPGPAAWGPFRKALENGLVGIRQMNEDDFEFVVGDKLEEQLENISQRFGGLNDDDFNKEHDRIMGILRKVRELDDDAFTRSKIDYVDQIFNEGKLGEFGRKADEQAGADRKVEQAVGAALLLNPLTIRALKRIAENGPDGEIPTERECEKGSRLKNFHTC